MPTTATPTHNVSQNPDTVHLANKLRTIRTAQGLTQQQCANTAHVHLQTWRNWETGTHRPTLSRGGSIAAALGVPIAALFVDYAVTELVLSDSAVQRVRREGLAAATELAEMVARSLPPLILAAATPAKPQPSRRAARGKPRRSRAEVLAGIQAANTAREARQTSGPPEGPAALSHGGLPGSSAGVEAVGGLSTLRAEEPEQ